MPAPSALGTRDILGMFYEELDRVQEPALVKKLCFEVNSDQASETYKMLWQSPAMRELVGGRQAKKLGVYSYTLANKIFEATIEYGVDDLRRDKTGTMRRRIADLVSRAQLHRYTLLADLIKNGHSSATCMDGQDFFDDDHSTGDSGTWQNDIDSSDVGSLAVTGSGTPTVAEAAQAILDVIGYMMAWKDEQGQALNAGARDFLVVSSYNNYGTFQAAIKGNVLVGTSGATSSSPLASSGFNIDHWMVPELSSGVIFWVFRTDGARKPFIMQEEQPLTPDQLAEGSDLAFNDRVHQFGVTAVRNAGYGWPHYGCRATMS